MCEITEKRRERRDERGYEERGEGVRGERREGKREEGEREALYKTFSEYFGRVERVKFSESRTIL